MGTLVRCIVAAPDGAEVREAIDSAFAAIDGAVRVMSEWEPSSDVSRLNDAAGRAISVDPSLVVVLQTAHRVSVASGGAFDVSWAPLRHIWCFEPGCELPSSDQLALAVEAIDYRKIEIDVASSTVRLPDGMEVGLGGIAKGYALAAAAAELEAAGIHDYLIEAGGDVYACGSNGGAPWRVGVIHPREDRLIDRVELDGRALVTSGDYERYIEVGGRRYHHILDPRTGLPARGLLSVSVASRDPAVADALATAAFVLGAREGLRLIESWEGAEGLLVDEDLQTLATTGWPGNLARSSVDSMQPAE